MVNPEYEPFKKKSKEERKGQKVPKKMLEVELHGLWSEKENPLNPEIYTVAGYPAVSAAALRELIGRPGAVQAYKEKHFGTASDEKIPLPDPSLTDTGEFTAEMELGLSMQAEDEGLGQLFKKLGDPVKGIEACDAVEALVEISAIETLLSTFILPLQSENIKTDDHRIHGSMNINTETGRLSCRRPNLQNQPSLEKDRYKVTPLKEEPW